MGSGGGAVFSSGSRACCMNMRFQVQHVKSPGLFVRDGKKIVDS